jgi:hypothetical protein
MSSRSGAGLQGARQRRLEPQMQTITTFLTFDDQAEEAVGHHTSIFPNSRIVSIRRYG